MGFLVYRSGVDEMREHIGQFCIVFFEFFQHRFPFGILAKVGGKIYFFIDGAPFYAIWVNYSYYRINAEGSIKIVHDIFFQ